MQELKDLFWQPGDPIEPMWIDDDGTIKGITLRQVKTAADLKKSFDYGI